MGERAEPMQWVLARHRQNTGEQNVQYVMTDTRSNTFSSVQSSAAIRLTPRQGDRDFFYYPVLMRV